MDAPHDLLEAICASPDDDALRARYAARIEASDPAHAELIRLQLARARHERKTGVVRSEPEGREAGLIATHGPRWSRALAPLLVPLGELPGDLGCRFERGFVGYARVAIGDVVGLGERLYALAPIQHLDVTPGEGDARRLFAVPGLDRLDSISLRGLRLGDAGAKALAACGALARATWMDLSNNDLEAGGVFALAGAAMMQNKVVVEFDPNPCDPVERANFEGDVLLDVSARFPPETVEAAVGHPVRWLHWTWGTPAAKPDRFHTRYVA